MLSASMLAEYQTCSTIGAAWHEYHFSRMEQRDFIKGEKAEIQQDPNPHSLGSQYYIYCIMCILINPVKIFFVYYSIIYKNNYYSSTLYTI